MLQPSDDFTLTALSWLLMSQTLVYGLVSTKALSFYAAD